MSKLVNAIMKFFREEQAPTSVEYAIMAALVAGVVVGSATLLGQNADGLLQSVLNALPGG